MVSKLPPELDNPIDVQIYEFCEFTSDWFYNHGFTPNMITTIGNVFRIVVLWLIWNGRFLLAAALWFISYYFDCLDGYVARKYKMTSKFGSLYDHVSDGVFGSSIIALLLYLRRRFALLLILLLIPLMVLCVAYCVAQNSYYSTSENEGDVLINSYYKLFPLVSKEESVKLLSHLKWFGVGTITVAYVIIIASCKL